MAVDPKVDLAVRHWAAWAPGLPDRPSWEQWARGERMIGGTARPDVQSVDSLQRRRLSDVSRMAFTVVEQCLNSVPGHAPHPIRFVFCSRYGEYPRSFDILWGLVQNEPVSPTAFSMSVHNTAASQFSIHRKDHSEFTALAAGETSLEAAFVEAWSQSIDHAGASVMVVYHDQPLPPIYRNQQTSVTDSLALALLLSQPLGDERDTVVRLTWQPSRLASGITDRNTNTILPLIRMLLTGEGPAAQDTGRLVWTWTDAAARR